MAPKHGGNGVDGRNSWRKRGTVGTDHAESAVCNVGAVAVLIVLELVPAVMSGRGVALKIIYTRFTSHP